MQGIDVLQRFICTKRTLKTEYNLEVSEVKSTPGDKTERKTLKIKKNILKRRNLRGDEER